MKNMLLVLAAALAAAFALSTSTALAAPTFSAHGSVNQVYVTGLKPGDTVTLVDSSGKTVRTQKASALGGSLFRDVATGDGYHVRANGEESDALKVLSDTPAPPSTDIYNQQIPTSGYGYMTMRDGTKLAIDVHPPQDISNAAPVGIHLPKSLAAPPGSPSPTLIEYSGYGYANPAGPTNGIAILANLMGFTVVDVNMRGT